MNSWQHENYQTSDLCLATTLSLYLPIENVDKSNTKRVVFTFGNSPKITEIIDSYWDNKLRVDPQQFFNQIKLIKSRIYGL